MMKMRTTLAALLLAGFALNAKAQTTEEDLDAKYATSLVQPGTVHIHPIISLSIDLK